MIFIHKGNSRYASGGSLNQHIGIAGMGITFPKTSVPLSELATAGRLTSDEETLGQFGFHSAFILQPSETLGELAVQAANDALLEAQLQSCEINAVIWTSALSENQNCPSTSPEVGFLGAFCYAASLFQERLACDQAQVFGCAQQGCAGMFGALRMAVGLLATEPTWNHVLCVGADAFPADAPREILYNVISDAACAVVVSRNAPHNRWLGSHQISRGYYWDTPAMQKEIVGAYYPTAQAAIRSLLDKTSIASSEIDWVLPSGINASSWPILLELLEISEKRLAPATCRYGHTINADNLLCLKQLQTSRQLTQGEKLLLFTYGFGSSWSAILLEH